jgi:hypothetical protein
MSELVDDELVNEIERVIEVLPLTLPLDLIIAGNLEREVKLAAPENQIDGPDFELKAIVTHFKAKRPDDSAVAAKAILPQPGGVHAIVVDGRVFTQGPAGAPEVGLGPVVRVIVHEAWHSVFQQRGEDPVSLYQRLKPLPDAQHFRVAAQVLDEYRVERATSADYGRRPGLDAYDAAHFVQAYKAFRRAPKLPQPGSDWLETGIGLCQYYGLLLASTAADQLANKTRFSATGPLWERAVGTYWDRALEILGRIPSDADRPTDVDEHLIELVELVGDWMNNVSVWAEGVPTVGPWR